LKLLTYIATTTLLTASSQEIDGSLTNELEELNSTAERGGGLNEANAVFDTLPEVSKTCPNYEDIRQRSVDGDSFDISEVSGVWYFLATNEPTIPSFCTCGSNNFTVEKDIM